MNRIFVPFILPICIVIQGCATTAIRNDPSKISDTGKRNTVVFSYDVKFKAFARHPEAQIASASLCQSSKDKSGIISGFTKGNRCFSIPASYIGNEVSENDDVMPAFAKKGIDVHQKKYGEYTYSSIKFRVLVDKRPELVCTEEVIDKKKNLRKTVCKNETENIFRSYEVNLPEPIPLNVAGGTGCFLGHISLNMTGNTLTEYSLDTETAALNHALVAAPIRDKVKSHVTRVC